MLDWIAFDAALPEPNQTILAVLTSEGDSWNETFSADDPAIVEAKINGDEMVPWAYMEVLKVEPNVMGGVRLFRGANEIARHEYANLLADGKWVTAGDFFKITQPFDYAFAVEGMGPIVP